MIEIYKTKDFNKYMLHRRETFIEECEKVNKRKATKEDCKLAADYFPLIYFAGYSFVRTNVVKLSLFYLRNLLNEYTYYGGAWRDKKSMKTILYNEL